ncbi:MAG: glucoamylase [Nevskia sp.]|nr:glucoamylase [Nevskia sp.]
MPLRIEDYALIGDCETAALVGRDGSIDWLCWPRFDSAACFAALLGTTEHGRWLLAPASTQVKVQRRYRDGTLLLETEFETAAGRVVVCDFMPPRDAEVSHLVRRVRGLSGRVAMRMELTPRFDYGSARPWIRELADGSGLSMIAGPDAAYLRSSTGVRIQRQDSNIAADFEIGADESVAFVLSYAASHLPPPAPIDSSLALEKTEALWRKWSGRSAYAGSYSDAVSRSLITLKALTYRPTGGIVAAPTTSLPEQLGGVRNWDYRYCWLRDATLTLLALMHGGYYDEALAWRNWLERTVAGNPDDLQIMYGIGGERRLAEWTADWLPGYESSQPVRIGNAAANQLQLDVYGELMDALHHARIGGLSYDTDIWELQHVVVQHLERIWEQPDEGIWETRGGRQHFTYSKVMSWVALDRSIKAVEDLGLEGPVQRWREVRQKIHADICTHGFDAQRGHFVQSYGGTALDASLLQIPLVGFLPPDDPRVQGTVAAIQRELVVDGFVLRYNTHETEDGLPANEGAFLACSFWLADNLILQGKLDEGRALFERLLSLRNDVGLLAEEYDPRVKRQVGNFPQAFSHIALVNTAFNLSSAQGPAQQRAQEGKSEDR